MNTFPSIGRYAIVAMLALGARTARADWGYAYAQVNNSETPSIDSQFSFNPGGGPITVSRTGVGSYTLVFSNAVFETAGEWLAAATPFAGSPNYCAIVQIEGNGGAISVQCNTPAGAPADTAFSLLAVTSSNDRNIAFVWDQLPSAASYTATSFSYNPSGDPITITRASTGNYQVAFNGLNGGGGTVLVTSGSFYGSLGFCTGAGWSEALTVNVQCYNPSGNPLDTIFAVFVVPGGVSPAGLAYTLATQPSSASYTPLDSYTYNPTGGGVNISRASTGNYTVTFANLNGAQLPASGLAWATAFNSQTLCQAGFWNPSPGSSVQVNVLCFDTSGNPADSEYTLQVLPASGYAYTLAGDGLPILAWVNPGAIAPLSTRNSTGNYTVTFPQSGIGWGWAPQVVSYGPESAWCKIQTWGENEVGSVQVLCFSPSGAPVNSQFVLTAVSNSNFNNIAFTVADQPTTSSYTPPSVFSYNPSGTIAVSRAATGSYAVTFNGLNGDGGTVQVTALGSDDTNCYSNGWESPNFEADVICVSPSGAQVDSAFVVYVISNGIQPPLVSYVWANQPTNAGYDADGNFQYTPGGELGITRSAQGQYDLNFSGAGCRGGNCPFVQGFSQMVDGNVIVTAQSFGAPARCNVANWNNGSDSGIAVNVNCYNLAGALTDAAYDVMVFSPIAGPPGNIIPVNSSESTLATTTFQPPLSVVVSDFFTNPIVNLPVTFTAPSSGPSGTFPGAALTVTVNTDTTGAATAPAFTANSTAGTYNVAASVLGMTSPGQISLTNTPLTTITLQTSPAGLMVSIDGGNPSAAPVTAQLIPGSTHTIATQSPQAGAAGVQYIWLNWSDGQAISHNITVPTGSTAYTATFKTQYQLTIVASPSNGGTVTPATGAFYDSGAVEPITATADPQFTFSNWSGAVANPSSASTTVTMSAPESVTANFSGAIACSLTLNHMSIGLPATGTSTVESCPNNSGQPNCGVLPETPASFTVTPSTACGTWTATSSNPEFLQINSGGAPAGGAGTVSYTLLTNSHTSPQNYSITLASGTASATYSVIEAGSGDSQVCREIYALYEQLLGRDPDAAGFAFWTGSGGAGLGQMADSFLTSPEAFNSDFAVMAAYQAATGGPPTFAQFTAAVASIRAGTQTAPGLFNLLTGSGFTAANLYQNLLNRAPGVADSSCTSMPLANCFQTIVGYPSNTTPVSAPNNEFQSTGSFDTDHTNALYVQMVYYVTVARDPDPAGLAFWTGIANNGGPGILFQGSAGYNTRLQILGPGTPNQGFIGSPEFQGLFAN